MRYCRSCQTTYPNEVLLCPKDNNATAPFSPNPQGDPYIGKFAGSYQIIEPLGEGGMGVVYLAKHPTLGKRAAVKLLHASTKERGKAIERFFSEAQIVSQLGHENIVDVYDFGLLEESQPFLVMEYLEGEPLSSFQHTMGLLEPKLAIGLTIQLLDALSAAHQRGVIHRDLKPDNVFLLRRRDRYFVKLLDFGIAKLGEASDLDSNRKQLTRPGMVIGTPHYMSPEQAQGLAVDARSDLYSVGVLLFEMLCGRPPFLGNNMAALVFSHVSKAPPSPRSIRPEVPAAIEAELIKALSKKPEERHQSADEMARALQAALQAPTGAPPTTPFIAAPAASDSGASELAEIPTNALPLVPLPQTPPPVPVEISAPSKPQQPNPTKSKAPLALVMVVLMSVAVWYGLSATTTEKEQVARDLPRSQPLSSPTPTTLPTPSAPSAPKTFSLSLASTIKGAKVKISIDGAERSEVLPVTIEAPQGSLIELVFSGQNKKWKKRLSLDENTSINWNPKEEKVIDMKGTLPLDLKNKK